MLSLTKNIVMVILLANSQFVTSRLPANNPNPKAPSGEPIPREFAGAFRLYVLKYDKELTADGEIAVPKLGISLTTGDKWGDWDAARKFDVERNPFKRRLGMRNLTHLEQYVYGLSPRGELLSLSEWVKLREVHKFSRESGTLVCGTEFSNVILGTKIYGDELLTSANLAKVKDVADLSSEKPQQQKKTISARATASDASGESSDDDISSSADSTASGSDWRNKPVSNKGSSRRSSVKKPSAASGAWTSKRTETGLSLRERSGSDDDKLVSDSSDGDDELETVAGAAAQTATIKSTAVAEIAEEIAVEESEETKQAVSTVFDLLPKEGSASDILAIGIKAFLRKIVLEQLLRAIKPSIDEIFPDGEKYNLEAFDKKVRSNETLYYELETFSSGFEQRVKAIVESKSRQWCGGSGSLRYGAIGSDRYNKHYLGEHEAAVRQRLEAKVAATTDKDQLIEDLKNEILKLELASAKAQLDQQAKANSDVSKKREAEWGKEARREVLKGGPMY